MAANDEWVDTPKGAQKLGATGEFPDGKISEDDEGELALAVGVTKGGEVFVDFGKDVKWFALPPGDAVELAKLIVANAEKAAMLRECLAKQTPSLVGPDGQPIKGG